METTEKIKVEMDSATDSVADKRAHEFFSDLVTKLNVAEFLYNIKGMSEREYQMWSAAINKNLEQMMLLK